MTISIILSDTFSNRRRSAALLCALLPITALAGCGKLGAEPSTSAGIESSVSPSADANDVAAVVGGREVRMAEVDAYLQKTFIEQLRSKPAAEVFEARNKGLQEMIQRQVIEAAAAERGVDDQELFRQITSEVPPPTSGEVTSWYTQNQERLRGARLEDVSANIEKLLTQEKQSQAWSAFIGPQIQALNIDFVMQPPRQELEATRLVRGDSGAAVTIMAFSDYQCPYCIRAEPVLAEVMARYPDQVRIVHRHFPLDSIHPFARPAAEAAMCADEQGKFWEYHEAIFARGGKLSADSFGEIGSELGLDAKALTTCIDERRYADFVQKDFDAGREAGVTGTPAFFVNGLALKGSRNADQLSEVIESELARVKVN